MQPNAPTMQSRVDTLSTHITMNKDSLATLLTKLNSDENKDLDVNQKTARGYTLLQCILILLIGSPKDKKFEEAFGNEGQENNELKKVISDLIDHLIMTKKIDINAKPHPMLHQLCQGSSIHFFQTLFEKYKERFDYFATDQDNKFFTDCVDIENDPRKFLSNIGLHIRKNKIYLPEAKPSFSLAFIIILATATNNSISTFKYPHHNNNYELSDELKRDIVLGSEWGGWNLTKEKKDALLATPLYGPPFFQHLYLLDKVKGQSYPHNWHHKKGKFSVNISAAEIAQCFQLLFSEKKYMLKNQENQEGEYALKITRDMISKYPASVPVKSINTLVEYTRLDDGIVWSKLPLHKSKNNFDFVTPDDFDFNFDPHLHALTASSNPQLSEISNCADEVIKFKNAEKKRSQTDKFLSAFIPLLLDKKSKDFEQLEKLKQISVPAKLFHVLFKVLGFTPIEFSMMSIVTPIQDKLHKLFIDDPELKNFFGLKLLSSEFQKIGFEKDHSLAFDNLKTILNQSNKIIFHQFSDTALNLLDYIIFKGLNEKLSKALLNANALQFFLLRLDINPFIKQNEAMKNALIAAKVAQANIAKPSAPPPTVPSTAQQTPAPTEPPTRRGSKDKLKELREFAEQLRSPMPGTGVIVPDKKPSTSIPATHPQAKIEKSEATSTIVSGQSTPKSTTSSSPTTPSSRVSESSLFNTHTNLLQLEVKQQELGVKREALTSALEALNTKKRDLITSLNDESVFEKNEMIIEKSKELTLAAEEASKINEVINDVTKEISDTAKEIQQVKNKIKFEASLKRTDSTLTPEQKRKDEFDTHQARSRRGSIHS